MRTRWADLVDGLEDRPHHEKLPILKRIVRERPWEKPPFGHLSLPVEVGKLGRWRMWRYVSEVLGEAGIDHEVKETSRFLWSRLDIMVFVETWDDLIVFLALEEKLRRFISAAA